MKKLNYIMASCFGVAGVACAIWALLDKLIPIGCLAAIFFMLAWVAWDDYKNHDE
jgi:hypothetical protein